MIKANKDLAKDFSKMAKDVRTSENRILVAYAREAKKPLPGILAKRYTLPKQRIKTLIEVQRATSKKEVALKFIRSSRKKGKSSPPSLMAYPGTEEKWRGVWFKILQSGGRKTIKGGFIRKVRGNEVAMLRKKQREHYTGRRASSYKIPFAKMPRSWRYPTSGIKAVSVGAMAETLKQPVLKSVMGKAINLTQDEIMKIVMKKR